MEDLKSQLLALGVNLLPNGKVSVKGQELNLSDFIGLGLAKVKTREEQINRLAQQLFSFDKTKHLRNEYQRIVLASEELRKMVKPFQADLEDYLELAKEKQQAKERAESERALEE